MACDNLDFLFKLLKSKADRPTMDKEIAKKFKITADEAHVITEMKFYQLSRLAKEELQVQIKAVEKQRKELDARKAKPAPHVLKQLKALA
jgi:DNA gyrase/topoisomerase IV subunit A